MCSKAAGERQNHLVLLMLMWLTNVAAGCGTRRLCSGLSQYLIWLQRAFHIVTKHLFKPGLGRAASLPDWESVDGSRVKKLSSPLMLLTDDALPILSSWLLNQRHVSVPMLEIHSLKIPHLILFISGSLEYRARCINKPALLKK